MNLRNRLLPLVGMRRLFGLAESALNENCRILVVTLGGESGQSESVGIVVDQVREVLRVDPSVRDKVPALLSCRFSRSSTGCFSRMFVMGRTRFPGLGGAWIGEGAVV